MYCEEYACCLFVCPFAYLENQKPNFTNFCAFPMAVARFSSADVAMLVLPVSWYRTDLLHMHTTVAYTCRPKGRDTPADMTTRQGWPVYRRLKPSQ